MQTVNVSAPVVNKSQAPISAAQKPFNGVILTGDLTAKSDGEFVITTRNLGFKRGSNTQVEFVEEHPIVGKTDLEIGSKISITGFIGRVPRGSQLIHRCIAVQITDGAGKGYQNIVKLSGRCMGNVHARDAKEGLEAFGRMFIDTAVEGGDVNGVRVTLFGDMLANWTQRVYPNRPATIMGYLNNRPRWNANGDKDVITEVRPHENKCVLHGPDQADPFAAFTDASAFSQVSAYTPVTPAPAEAPKASTKGKGKKGEKPSDDQAPPPF
jgi:hypothetical protein